jgi:putative ABC transport system permease protein
MLSLIVGMFIGVFLSQGLASVTAKMFDANMSKYKFIFSKGACLKTILYFSIMFIVVVLLNFIVVSRYKLIKLINNEKRSEKLKGNNLILSLVLFILSIICLYVAYKSTLGEKLIYSEGGINAKYIILGILGTILFFRALAGFLIIVIQSSKNYYFKNLNTFTLRQLNSKINTHYMSVSVICIMLFIAIGMTSAGIGIKKSLETSMQFKTPFDISFNVLSENIAKNGSNENLSDLLNQKGFDINEYSEEFIDYNVYISDITYGELFKNNSDKISKQQFGFIKDLNVEVIKLSDYNKLKKMKKQEQIGLNENEVLLLSDVTPMTPVIEEYLSQNKSIKLINKEFELKNNYEYEAIYTSTMSMNLLTLIINDKYVKDLSVHANCLNLNYKGEKTSIEEKILKDFDEFESNSKEIQNLDVHSISKIESYDSTIGMSTIFLYVGIYVGMIFLIASAAVLALSQLSGATESLNRYKVLRKLGVSSEMINKSIFTQVLLYFTLPILLALVHSIFGIKVTNDVVKIFGDVNVVKNNLFAIGAILIVYAIYFVTTYNGYKRIVNK